MSGRIHRQSRHRKAEDPNRRVREPTLPNPAELLQACLSRKVRKSEDQRATGPINPPHQPLSSNCLTRARAIKVHIYCRAAETMTPKGGIQAIRHPSIQALLIKPCPGTDQKTPSASTNISPMPASAAVVKPTSSLRLGASRSTVRLSPRWAIR